ncbi:single-stranded-DNA-specific exonuclease RecJ, partial [Candidatus Daviesbacteria bacterium]|nr:single-stranded-DNA-specific exonuclease RecJ [Candidatus Daviesbacteria bacterium]
PKLSDFKKDLEIPGINKALGRVLGAIKHQELILVYGDYDADGLCATAVMYLGLTAAGAKVLPYIPHREKEGYGLSRVGLEVAKEKGAKLVITVDNGIAALEAAQEAEKLGLDLIITDHHLPKETLPKALAIVHSTAMCGAAVSWCLVRQLIDESIADDLLDLVAIAAVCDMMPMIGVNRALTKIGLEKLNQTKKVGLLALMKQAQLQKGKINAYHIGHVLGPRLNAKGRLEHSLDTLRLLCTKDAAKARDLANMLGDTNDQRKQLVEEGLMLARSLAKGNNKNIMVLESETWIPGITGLIAGKIREEYNLPTIVISKGEEFSKGSARSINGLNIVETIRQCSEILVDVGGHPGAAGFTITTEKIGLFKTKLAQICDGMKMDQTDKLVIEAVVKTDQLSLAAAYDLTKFEPTGVSNLKPILASLGVKLSDLKTVGGGQHLKGRTNGVNFIAFGMGNLIDELSAKEIVDLAYYLDIDDFDGNEKIQLKVLDVQY